MLAFSLQCSQKVQLPSYRLRSVASSGVLPDQRTLGDSRFCRSFRMVHDDDKLLCHELVIGLPMRRWRYSSTTMESTTYPSHDGTPHIFAVDNISKPKDFRKTSRLLATSPPSPPPVLRHRASQSTSSNTQQ